MSTRAPAAFPPASFAAKNLGDRLFHGLTAAFALLFPLVLGALTLEMIEVAMPSIVAFGPGFLVGRVWDPVHQVFGALPFVYGTVGSSLLALVLAVPVSLGVAIYLSELAPDWQRGVVGSLIELLAAVPSIVYGLWGAFALAPFLRTTVEPALAAVFGFLPFFRGPQQGFGLLAGGIVLAIMIVPTIASVSRDVLRAVPTSQREAALALGATRSEMVRRVVLPYARSGIVGATLLGLGRALGETMAVTLVIGNRAEISASLFAPAHTIPSVLANEFSEASGELHLAALAEMALVLLFVTLLLNALARLLVLRVTSVRPSRDA